MAAAKKLIKLMLVKEPRNGRHLKNPKIRDKGMTVSPPKPYYHTFVSYFQVFEMSTISRVWPTALKLGCVTNFDMLFLVMGSFLWLMKFNLC